MTRKIQAAWLATGLFIIVPVAVAAQAAPTGAQPAKPAPTAAVLPPTATAEDIEAVRAEIRAKRKSVVAANMTLTADEATRFWPLYDQYTEEVRKLNDKVLTLIQDYAKTYDKMTDEQARTHREQSAAIDAERIALRGKWMPQFEKLVSPKKTAQFYQLDRRLDLLLNLQLSSLLPLVDPTK